MRPLLRRADGNEARSGGETYRCEPVPDAELSVDPGEVRGHGPFPNPEACGDLASGQALGCDAQHLTLTLGQPHVEVAPALDAIGDLGRP